VVVGGSPPVIGPEYQLLTTSTVLRRINFINQAFAPASGRAIDVVRGRGTTPSGVDPVTGNPLIPTGPLGTAVDISFLQPLATDPAALVERLNTLMMHGSMTAELKADLVTAISAVSATNTRKRARTAVYLVATSSQYQVQK
jgi:phenylpyruvate tautomerase PptA (4-oxalocrotonate tautomerase family)